MTKRFLWADVVRILAIYFVIVVHSTVLPSQITAASTFDFISFAIAKTCVPLFFMLSGALLLSKDESDFMFFKKRFTRLFFPWAFWTIIFFLLNLDFHTISLNQTVTGINTAVKVFWFIPIITVLYVATPALRSFLKNSKNNHIFTLLIIWFVLISLLPYLRNTLAFPVSNNSILWQAVGFSGFFVIGYLAADNRIRFAKGNATLLTIIGLLLTIIGTYITFFSSLKLSYFDYFSPSIVILSVGIFTFIQNVFTGMEYKISFKIRGIAAKISSSVLGVYLLHTLILVKFSFINKKLSFFSIYHPLDNYLNGLILFLLSLIIILTLKRIRFLSRMVS